MNDLRAAIVRLEQESDRRQVDMRRTFNALVAGGRRTSESYVAPRGNVQFFAAVDPNHMLGSTVELKNGRPFHTQFNLCSTLYIDVPNFDILLNQKGRSRYIGYKSKYLKKFDKSLKRVKTSKRRWLNMKKAHLHKGQLPELAWKNPERVNEKKMKEVRKIAYTASYPAKLIDLATATASRKGRPWRYVKNRHHKRGTFPVIETCGVILRAGRQLLTFPNFKFASNHSVPGGSVDWTASGPPRNLEEQAMFVAQECLRELREESGISIELEETPNLTIVADANIVRGSDLYARIMNARSITLRRIDETDMVRLLVEHEGRVRLIYDHRRMGATVQLPWWHQVGTIPEEFIRSQLQQLDRTLGSHVTHFQFGEHKIPRIEALSPYLAH